MEAYKTAIAAGVSPADFWGMTPYLSRLAVKALSEETITRIWTLAAMTRTKKLPTLEKLLNKKVPGQDVEAKLKRLFTEHNTRLRKGNA